MARSEFSETSFAFAFFHHLTPTLPKKFSFIFPTLAQEGDFEGKYGGADLIINSNIFIQFKVSDYLKSENVTEIRNEYFGTGFLPYYRIYIKNSPDSYQFNKLKLLSKNKNNFVCYVAPLFYEQEIFMRYFHSNLIQNTIYIDFKDLDGINIEENDEHTICYNQNEVAYMCSEPIKIKLKRIIEKLIPDEFFNIRKDSISYKQISEQIIEIFNIPDRFRTNVFDIQRYLIIENNIIWIPQIINK